MTRSARAIAAVLAVLAWTAPAWSATSVKLPPPDLRGLVPLAALPVDKPPVPVPAIAAPAPPESLPELPAPQFVADPSERPTVIPPPPRMLACNPLGSVFGVASELLECGRSRYQRGELEDAQQALQKAIQESSDRRILREARYWLGETLVRLNRAAEAERAFQAVAQDDARSEFGLYANHGLGWLALQQGAPARALGYFDTLIKDGAPAPIAPYASHGRAMALYGLKRYTDAREQWAQLLNLGGFSRSTASANVVSDANFWLGDTLGRLGDFKGAANRLEAYTSTGPRTQIASSYLRLGWWSRAAGQPVEAVKAYRSVLSGYPRSPEATWARAGLVQALLDQDDYSAAMEEARQLDAADRGRTLSLPTWLNVRRWLADKSRTEEARALDDDLLARTLQPATRAWLLLMNSELARQSGQADEARSRLELIRQSAGQSPIGLYAGLRLAQLDFDLREFDKAEASAKSLLAVSSLPPDLRAAALVLGAEAAYWARHYDEAAELYTRLLSEQPSFPDAPAVGLALGWTEFRRGQLDAARERWTAFARQAPTDPKAADALLLSAELAARAGDLQTAQAQLAQVEKQFQGSDQAQVAALNRGILALDAGRPADALPALSLLVVRAPTSPYIGRMHVAKGMALLGTGRAADAQADFRAARTEGEDVLARLGLGSVAFAGGDWAGAASEFAAARDAGSGAAALAAEYGVAAATFNEGRTDEFKRLATAMLAKPEDPRVTPAMLLGMTVAAAGEKRWPEAREMAAKLQARFPQSEAASAALADVGATAAADGQWPLTREMYEALFRKNPAHPGIAAGRLGFGEALLRTGAPADAKRELDAFTAATPVADPRMPRALLLLAQANEATGNRAAAVDLYARVERDYPNHKEQGTVLLNSARLLQADGKWPAARTQLERAIEQADTQVVTEAAYRLGEGLRAAGQNEDAVEAYMTAAYLAPDSPWGRRALLGAGHSFVTLKQPESAAVVYKKLLAASGVEAELAAEARTQLKTIEGN